MKFKLIAGFLIALLAVGSAGYFAYLSFNNLLRSVDTLALPDKSIETLREIVSKVQESEVLMRSYTMTMSDSTLQLYLDKTEEIRDQVDSLKTMASFSGNSAIIDSINDLLQKKADLMYALVTFKNSPEYNQLAQNAMGKISRTIEPGTQQKVGTFQTRPGESTIRQNAIKQPIASSEEDPRKRKKDKKEKDEGFLKNIFSGKEATEPDKAPTIVTITDTSVSSSSSVNINITENESLDIEEVRRILSDLDKEQKRNNATLTNYELEILTSDQVIMNNLRQMVGRIETDQQNKIDSQVLVARENAKSSSRIILLISAASLFIGLIFMVIILNDISRGNRYRRQLETARAEAVHLAKAKEEFLANMSHEIRTPLNAIIGFSEQLTQTPLHDTQKKYLKAVQQAGTHLLNTVNDILDISKIEAGKLPLEEKQLRIRDLVEEVVSILDVKAKEKNLRVEYTTDEQCEKFVTGDAFRLMQILYNLAGNAIKFTDTGYVRIECSGTEYKQMIDFKIEVIDTGIGIESDKLTKIFESFAQADTATTRKFGGTGLGLSISKKLTEFMKGSIQVKSEPGIGSVFTIHLPLPRANDEGIDVVQQESTTDNNLSGLQILIVDDEPYNLMLSEVILKKHGAKTQSANSGKEALGKIENQYFDLILADLQMPEIDGYMLAKKIREKFIDVPLIALTANVMQGETEVIRKVGFNGILLKPYKEYELLKIIAENAPVVIGDVPVMQTAAHSELMQDAALFDLDEVKLFTDDDTATLLNVIRSFVDNNKLNLQALENAIKTMNLIDVRNIAHKMLPSYTHFRVHEIIGTLKEMESMVDAQPDDLYQMYTTVEQCSRKVFDALGREITRLDAEKVIA